MGGRGKDGFDIHSTFFPLTFINEIFQDSIARIDKDEKGAVYSYYCFDSVGELKIKIEINWRKHKITFYKKINGKLMQEKYYMAQNLFDVPDNKGKYK